MATSTTYHNIRGDIFPTLFFGDYSVAIKNAIFIISTEKALSLNKLGDFLIYETFKTHT